MFGQNQYQFSAAKFGSVVACLALVFASLITGAIAFESRHLATATFAQKFIAVGIAFLPALSTFVVSFFKLFAPASKTHDKWLWACMGLDLTALLLQSLGIAAREVGGNDGLLQTFNILSYAAAALSALAIGIAAGTSDHRLAAVDAADAERALIKKRYELRQGVLENDNQLLQEIADDERGRIRAQNKYAVLNTPALLSTATPQEQQLLTAVLAKTRGVPANGGTYQADAPALPPQDPKA